MKHLSILKNMALACSTLAAAVALSSCSSTISPNAAAERLATGSNVTVFSHNDVNHPNNRDCREAGPLPERTARALQSWLRNSTVKSFTYAYPQYYLAMQDSRTDTQRAWGICSDGHGNLVGVLVPRDGVMAWDLPPVGEYRMYVCDTASRKALSEAIMNSLADAGYDTYRIDSRKAMGLTQQRYLISKPLSDEAQKRYDLIKKQEEQQQKGAAKDETTDEESESEDSDSDASTEEESSTEEEDTTATEEESTGDDGFDELGF